VRAPAFRSEARRQSLAMAASFRAHDDQAFIDAVSIFIWRSGRALWDAATRTVAGSKNYAGEAVIILQDDSFDGTESITICAFTTDGTDTPLFWLPVELDERNGLRIPCHLMVDKMTTIPKSKVGAHIGRLDDKDALRLNRALLVFLGLATSPRIKEAWAVTGRKRCSPKAASGHQEKMKYAASIIARKYRSDQVRPTQTRSGFRKPNRSPRSTAKVWM
jgi:mRNA interferase MazF